MYGLALGSVLLADTEIMLGLSSYKNIDEICGKRVALLEKADSIGGQSTKMCRAVRRV
jgi:hypothetical protein